MSEEDLEFEQLLRQKQHKELLVSLNNIVITINKSIDKSGIEERQLKAIEELKIAIHSLPLPDVTSVLQKMEEGIINELKQTNKDDGILHEWNFKLNKDIHGNTVNIIAKQIR